MMKTSKRERAAPNIIPLGTRELPAALKLVKGVFNAADEDKAVNELTIYIKAKETRVDYGHDYWVAKVGRRTAGVIGLEYVGKDAEKKGIRTLSIECGTLPMFAKANKLYDEFGFKDKFTIDDFWAHNDDLLVKSKRILPHTHTR